LFKCLLTLMLIYPVIPWSRNWVVQSAQSAPREVGQSPSSPEIARRLLPSIVKLVGKDAAGKQFALGYGFFVDRWTIVTNHHILKDAKNNTVAEYFIFAGDAKFYHVNYVTPYEKSGLLFLDVEERGPQPLPLGKTDKFNSGDKAYLIDEGIFAQSQAPGTDRLIEVTLPLPPESSGLPVLDRSGLVLGIATDTRAKSAPASGVIPAKELTGKIKQYFSYEKGDETVSPPNKAGKSSGSGSVVDSPTAEREAGGQVALQPTGASRTPSVDTPGSIGSTSRPKVLKSVKAPYTQEARNAGISGTVLVSITIDEQGEVSKAKIVRGHPLLILTSLRAARRCLFIPGMKEGVPAKIKSTLEFSFNTY
jgi:TonB family protein